VEAVVEPCIAAIVAVVAAAVALLFGNIAAVAVAAVALCSRRLAEGTAVDNVAVVAQKLVVHYVAGNSYKREVQVVGLVALE
jgi:hypothetical protein